ncbi:hypothetical protein GWI33_008545 [Rhynchophorus ferrugineus]|uniref:Uncharacterized protein n=1 Tax=Rhynchophorus ferrugineus TaxID=354439 RepID=A0A834IEM3_RHYFE|nr:hypothetical protein GWI33_008545 [Rhynchophorus ferrugineus]
MKIAISIERSLATKIQRSALKSPGCLGGVSFGRVDMIDRVFDAFAKIGELLYLACSSLDNCLIYGAGLGGALAPIRASRGAMTLCF